MFPARLAKCNAIYKDFIVDPDVLTPASVSSMLGEILTVYPVPGTRAAMISNVKNAFRRLIMYAGDIPEWQGMSYYDINRIKRNSLHHPVLGALRLPACDKAALVLASVRTRERNGRSNRLLCTAQDLMQTMKKWLSLQPRGISVDTAKVAFALGAVSGLRAREVYCSACVEVVDEWHVRHCGHVGGLGKDVNADRVIETLVPAAVFVETLDRLRNCITDTGRNVKYIGQRLATLLRASEELDGLFDDTRETGKLPRQCYPILFIDSKGIEVDDMDFPIVAQRLLGHRSPLTTLHYQRFR